MATVKNTGKLRSKQEKEVFQVSMEAVPRCSRCGATSYVLPTTKYLLNRGCKYCAGCGGLLVDYDFTASGELQHGIAGLDHLQYGLSDQGISYLGSSIDEIEAKLFQILNNATVAFRKFKDDSFFSGEKESLQGQRERILRNKERELEKEIRKTIPKEGKTRIEIKTLVEKKKKQLIEQAKIAACPNIVTLADYRRTSHATKPGKRHFLHN